MSKLVSFTGVNIADLNPNFCVYQGVKFSANDRRAF